MSTTEVRWHPPVAVAASPEMEALRRFHFDCTWTGKVEANGMGPGSPEMLATGNARYQSLMGGAWLMGDFEQDQFVDGTLLVTWKAHFVIGWDARMSEYRATYVDNNGSAALLRGRIEGTRFVAEVIGDGPVRNRMEWALLPNGVMHWRNECSIQGGPWQLVEEYDCTPAPPPP